MGMGSTTHHGRPTKADHSAASQLDLPTWGGRHADQQGVVSAPFFHGYIQSSEQTAVALLQCARIAATRYYRPPNVTAAILRAADPVVTSNGDRLRFESFSACAGVYARLDILPDGFDAERIAAGTTNVDLNSSTRIVLADFRGREPMLLNIGDEGLSLTALAGQAAEKKVPLSRRWVRSFAEAQVIAGQMSLRREMRVADARRFVRALPASARGCLWGIAVGRSLRLSARPQPGAVGIAGPQRLRTLEPLLPFAESVRVYGPDVDAGTDAAASAWQLDLPGARFTIMISPELNRGFSGEGGLLFDLADQDTDDDADLISGMLAWDSEIDIDRLTDQAPMDRTRVERALSHLAGAGRVGYDLATGRYFHRELPYERELLEQNNPRLAHARALVDAGAVSLTADCAVVRSRETEYTVTFGSEGSRCNCPWWGRHRGSRGPCKHELAADIVAGR